MRGRYWCEHAWLGGDRAADSVRIDVADGRIVAVHRNSPAGNATRLYGVTLPGFANTHSHAFHRLLRGRTQSAGGDFWSWREMMYKAAAELDPPTYLDVAERVFTEMLRAGYTVVGEFHYLHHEPGGMRYRDPNAMGTALLIAAQRVGIRITLLDTLYQHGGLVGGSYSTPDSVQRRFVERPAEWAERVDQLDGSADDMVHIGAAIHSVRTVDADGIAVAAGWADRRRAPLHAHVSEQAIENTQSLAAHGLTPVALLDRHRAVSSRFTAVHGTHLDPRDIASLGDHEATVCFCPTTERDLADGVGPSAELISAGAHLTIGSDSQAFIDPFEESRAIELNRRLIEGTRGHHPVSELLGAATHNGYRALGWPEGGIIREGALADFVTVRLTGPRMNGSQRGHLLESVLYSAHPEDVTNVVVGGINHDYV